MQNKEADIKEIEAAIEYAGCYNPPAAAARDAAKVVDNVFVVIHRDELPDVEATRDNHFTLTQDSKPYEFTYFEDPDHLRSVGLRYLAAAEHMSLTKDVRETNRLAERTEVWVELTRGGKTFDWETMEVHERQAITEIIYLRKKLASAK